MAQSGKQNRQNPIKQPSSFKQSTVACCTLCSRHVHGEDCKRTLGTNQEAHRGSLPPTTTYQQVMLQHSKHPGCRTSLGKCFGVACPHDQVESTHVLQTPGQIRKTMQGTSSILKPQHFSTIYTIGLFADPKTSQQPCLHKELCMHGLYNDLSAKVRVLRYVGHVKIISQRFL